MTKEGHASHLMYIHYTVTLLFRYYWDIKVISDDRDIEIVSQ